MKTSMLFFGNKSVVVEEDISVVFCTSGVINEQFREVKI